MTDAADAVEMLLVEDNPTDAELTIETLKENKLATRLVWVKDGAQALDFLFRRGNYATRADRIPKVILLDLRLPKVDGLEVLKEVKADMELNCVPVVVLTSSREERDISECYKHGANSFVSKPVQFESFANTITDLGLYWLLLNKTPVLS
ncbi:MAG TPA: response regulator [Gallionella sp.]|nr:response regulator [Gallionella sp.]